MNNQPVQVVVHQPRQTTLVFPGPHDQTCCSIFNMLLLVVVVVVVVVYNVAVYLSQSSVLFAAGLLTQDPRVHERQKPGQYGPRRKYTWYAYLPRLLFNVFGGFHLVILCAACDYSFVFV